MPYTLSCSPAPVTFTIRPRLAWRFLLSLVWDCWFGYQLFKDGFGKLASSHLGTLVFFAGMSLLSILWLIRRERIEIYPDRMVWRKTYFGITHAKTAPLADVLGAEWDQGVQDHQKRTQEHVEFYLANGQVKACFGFTFEDFDRMREDIRLMYPALVARWGHSSVRSKSFTLLQLN